MTAVPVAPTRVLVVALRRLGDVLLTTPLIRSIRRAWPNARIDVLVFSDTTAILAGNPDVDRVLAMPARPTAQESLMLAARLARRYDIAVSTQGGDRPTFFAVLAGRVSVGPAGSARAIDRIKRALLTRPVSVGEGLHRVEETLRLADALGVARVGEVVCPARPVRDDLIPDTAYAMIHPTPMFRYKRWTVDGWRTLIRELADRNLKVLVTGGPAAVERAYLDELLAAAPAVARVDGALTWHEISALLAQAQVFVGPDTSVTHLAAAAGAPTVALYGPTDPRLWGPWPKDGLAQPWQAAAHVQQRGNVWLVQNPLPCLPCQSEGCDLHRESRSRCLDELLPSSVMPAVDQALAFRRAAGRV